MDFREGFAVLRPLGESGQGEGYLPFAALTAIHVTHRLGAFVLIVALLVVAAGLWRIGDRQAQRFAMAWLGLAAWQLVSGLSNVVLGWPLLAAIAHSAGAALMITLAAVQLTRAAQAHREPTAVVRGAPAPAGAMPIPSR